jgi:hypothetical protein
MSHIFTLWASSQRLKLDIYNLKSCTMWQTALARCTAEDLVKTGHPYSCVEPRTWSTSAHYELQPSGLQLSVVCSAAGNGNSLDQTTVTSSLYGPPACCPTPEGSPTNLHSARTRITGREWEASNPLPY